MSAIGSSMGAAAAAGAGAEQPLNFGAKGKQATEFLHDVFHLTKGNRFTEYPNVMALKAVFGECLKAQKAGQNPNVGSFRDKLIKHLGDSLPFEVSRTIMENLQYTNRKPGENFDYTQAPDLFDQLKALIKLEDVSAGAAGAAKK